jgi:phosphatidylglycerophosphate synthase
MLDLALRPRVDRVLGPLARQLARAGVGADQLTVAGFLFGMGAVAASATGRFDLGLGLFLVNRLADALDGLVARLTQPTARGAIVDIVADFVVYAGVPLAFALADPANAVAAAFLLFCFMGTASSFLAFAIGAAGRGQSSPGKGFAHLAGLAEGTETIAFVVLVHLRPDWFMPAAWVFGAMCLVTTVSRVAIGWRRLTDRGTPP